MSDPSAIKKGLEREFQEHGFVTPGILPQLCPVEDIRLLLALDASDQRPNDIFDTSLKIFSILTLLNQPSIILKCLERGLNDEWAFNSYEQQPFCMDEHLHGTVLEPFGELIRKQWIFTPPLSRDVHYEFPPAFLEALSKKAGMKIARGGFGTIHEHEFRQGQLRACEQGGIFALKRITQRIDTSREDLKREPDIMREFRHKAITPLLASFEVSADGSSQKATEFYIVMPLAVGGNMEDWIHETTPPEFLSSRTCAQKQDYLLSQIESLHSALAFLHTPKTAESHIVLHFDLRPKNFLLFADGPGPYPIWKISDFGIAQLAKNSERRRTHAAHDYAPPEVFGLNGIPYPQAYGREFDMFSMACVSLQLLTLACKGWGKFILEFDLRRQGETKDKSFGKHRDQVYAWIEDLRRPAPREDRSKIIDEIIDLVKETIESAPDERLMAWEVPVYMLLASEPEPDSSHVRLKLGKMVPQATEAESRLSQGPVARAREKGHQELASLLVDKRWFPIVSSRLEQHNSDVDPRVYLSNLSHTFRQTRLLGKTPRRILAVIEAAFNECLGLDFVGLWGLGGMGKSHIAYAYASQFQKNSEGVRPRHTFWINASDQSKLDRSCQEIKAKVGSRDDMDPLPSVKMWLEDESNGPWILVLDGLDHAENLDEWLPQLPRAKHGMTIVTTRDRDILESFTRLKPRSTIKVDPLPVEDAQKIFNDIIKDHDPIYKPTDEQFRKLHGFVLTPLFTKFAAAYIVRGPGGPEAIDGLIDKLSKELTYIGNLNSAGKRKTQEDRLFEVFSFFLSPFDAEYDISSEEFVLLGILACFASDDLNFEAFKGLCDGDGEVARGYLAVYVSYGFITSEGRGSENYKMHDLVSEFILLRIAQMSKSEKATMVCFRWMLDRIYRMYCDARETIHEADGSPLRRDSYLWKLPYLPHFEEFSRYIQRLKHRKDDGWRIEDWKMRPYTTRSIITFSQAFASQNRIDHAIDMLQFVVDHGVESTGTTERDLAEVQRVTIKVLNSLATRLEDKRPVGGDNQFLNKALVHASSGLQKAKEADSPGLIWRLSLQVIRILIRLDSFHEAAKQTKLFRLDIQELGPRIIENDKVKVALDGEMSLATLFFNYGLSEGKQEFFISSSKIYRGLIEWFERNAPEEETTLDCLKAKLAALLIEVPDPDLLDEAHRFYAAILKRSRAKRNENKLNTEVVDDELNLAILLMRQGKPSEAATALKPVFDQLLSQFGADDELTKTVAHNLADAYDMAGDLVAARVVYSKFEARPPDTVTRGGRFLNDPHGTWISEIKSQRVDYGSGILSMNSTEDVLLDLMEKDGEQVEESQMGAGRREELCIVL